VPIYKLRSKRSVAKQSSKDKLERTELTNSLAYQKSFYGKNELSRIAVFNPAKFEV